MNDKHLDDLFVQAIPEADPNAKKIAINAAMSEFSQASEAPTRPIDNRDNWFSTLTKSIWSFFMNPTQKPGISSAFVTGAIAFVAISLVFIMPSLRDENPSSISEAEQIGTLPATSKDDRLEEVVTTSRVSAVEEQGVSATDKIAMDVPNDSFTVRPIEDLETGNNIALEETIVTARKNTATDQSAPVAIAPSKPTAAEPSKKREREARRVQSIRQKHVKSFEEIEQLLAAPSAVANSSVAYDKTLVTGSELAGASSQPRLDSDEEYAEYESSTISLVSESPVSTFSIDVDTASYSLIRNQLNNGFMPNPQAVRAEELINYFNYQYDLPRSKKQPFQPSINVIDSPWNAGKKLVHIGIKGYDLAKTEQPDSNLVMRGQNKLPLVKQSINLLLETLKPTDTVSIAVYAGAAGMVLEPTPVKEKTKILNALQNLNAGGSTAGGAGIELAYQLAEQNFNKGSVNRIILATDGDFNVGQDSNQELKTLVERKRDKGVYLSVLGFGRNNYQDDMMQTLAQNGNGVAAYIDTLSEAKKVLVDEATSTLFTIAQDVKIQVEFNPATVSEYRLVGYETRALNREDFNNDKVDAGDIGAGHTVTAIYEITPADSKNQSIDQPRYADNGKTEIERKASAGNSNEYAFLKIRYKLPSETNSKLIEQAITKDMGSNSSEVAFSTAVAGFAQLLTGGKYTGGLSYDKVIETALKNKGQDPFGYRSEFIQLVRMAKIAKN